MRLARLDSAVAVPCAVWTRVVCVLRRLLGVQVVLLHSMTRLTLDEQPSLFVFTPFTVSVKSFFVIGLVLGWVCGSPLCCILLLIRVCRVRLAVWLVRLASVLAIRLSA